MNKLRVVLVASFLLTLAGALAAARSGIFDGP
jgi:hypothetical protein